MPTQAAILLHMVTSAQTAGSHLQVPSNRPNEQLLDRATAACAGLQLTCTAAHLANLQRNFSQSSPGLSKLQCFLLNPFISANYKNKDQIPSSHKAASVCASFCSLLFPVQGCRGLVWGLAGAFGLTSGGEADPHPRPRCAGCRAHPLGPCSASL